MRIVEQLFGLGDPRDHVGNRLACDMHVLTVDGDVIGNGFANHRSGDESCRRVWLVALGAGVPKGTGTERPIRTFDVAPTVASGAFGNAAKRIEAFAVSGGNYSGEYIAFALPQ